MTLSVKCLRRLSAEVVCGDGVLLVASAAATIVVSPGVAQKCSLFHQMLNYNFIGEKNSCWLWLNLSGKHNLTLNQSMILYTHGACIGYQSHSISLLKKAWVQYLSKILCWFSAHLRIVKSANSKFPDVSLLITYHI